MHESHEQKWPSRLWLVRHGESAANVARAAAYAAGHHTIDVATRDVDVPLSELGERQATALGHWFRSQPALAQPTAILTSPYLRARNTAEIVQSAAGLDPSDLVLVVDERLREKEFGIFDRLTNLGVQEHYPDLWAQRTLLGKFYFRPPGGESWADVILRLRSIIDTLTRDYCKENVLIVAHSVVVLCFRYLLERMTEEEVLGVDRTDEVANCSVTAYAFDPTLGRHGKLALQTYNFVAPLLEEGAPVTTEPDVKVVPSA